MKFFDSLLSPRGKEVAVVSRLVGQDVQTIVGLNLLNIRLETKQRQYSKAHSVDKVLYEQYFETQTDIDWRITLLFKYLRLRNEI